MATNLLIGFPQITIDATAVTPSGTEDSTMPAKNLIAGARARHYRLNAAATSNYVTFDLGSSQQKTIQFYYVARADLLQRAGSKRVLLQGSTDNVSYSSIAGTTSSFQSKTLYGPRGEDIIFTSDLGNSDAGTLPATPTYRYWRHYAAGSGSCPSDKYQHSKAYFGSFFDFGVDPQYPGESGQALQVGRNRREIPLRFVFTYSGITNTIRQSFENLIHKYRMTNPVILYTKSFHKPLEDARVVFGMITKAKFTPSFSKKNNLTLEFEELI